MATDYQGKNVVVTGASSGIGAAIGLELARRGGRVILVAQRADRLAQIAQQIAEGGGSARAVICDISTESRSRTWLQG